MSTYFFKTNINCIECVDRVKPQLDKLEQDKSIEHWHLDLNNPEYVLEIETNMLSPEQVKHIIRETGFDAHFTQPPSGPLISCIYPGNGTVGTRISIPAVLIH